MFKQILRNFLFLVSIAIFGQLAHAAEIKVITSGGLAAAFDELRPGFEEKTGHHVLTAYGSSMGGAPDSIHSRLDKGETADVLLLASAGVDDLIQKGKIVPGTRVDLVRSLIGAAVKKGGKHYDISTVQALKKSLMEATSVAYSASASGTYLSTELFKKLGLEEEMKVKAKRIVSERVGTVIARGDAELGFQQVSELLPIASIDYLGPIPLEVQQMVFFSAGIASSSTQQQLAKELIEYLASPEAAPTLRKYGLDPLLPVIKF